MCICIIHIFVYIVRSLLPACARGREEERTRLEQKCDKTGYTERSEFETPSTAARDVKPEPKWHGATEEDILNIIRYQKSRGVQIQNVHGRKGCRKITLTGMSEALDIDQHFL